MKEKCSIQECDNVLQATGLCYKHYKRKQIHGDVEHNYNSETACRARFWSNVAITSNPEKCWIWQGKLNRDNYGKFWAKIFGKSQTLAHRIAFYFYYGVDPKNSCCCHKCDNPRCVNPNHLFLATSRINQADKVAKQRQARGEKQRCAKLTDKTVKQIKHSLKAGESLSNLADRFGVAFQTIGAIKSGKTWKHIKI